MGKGERLTTKEAYELVKAKSLAKNLTEEEMKEPIKITGKAAKSLVAELKLLDRVKAHSLTYSSGKIIR